MVEEQEEWPPSPSPVPELPNLALPTESREFAPGLDEFWELPPLPPGAVLTYELPGPGKEDPSSIFAVMIQESDLSREGLFLQVKFLGATQDWAKQQGSTVLNRQKRGIHICRTAPRECAVEAGAHLTNFTYWPPGQFTAGYVDKRVLKEMEKFLNSLKGPPPKAAEDAPKAPGSVQNLGDASQEADSGAERLAKLREKLVGHRATAGAGHSVHFAETPSFIPQRPSALRRPAVTSAPQEAIHVVSSGGESEGAEKKPAKRKKETVGTALVRAVQEKTLGTSSSSNPRAASSGAIVKREDQPKEKKKKEKKSSGKSKKKKKKKEPSSSSEYETESSSSEILPPLQKKAKKQPGSVLKVLMDHVRKSLSDASVLGAGEAHGGSSTVNSPARVQSYFQILVRGHLAQRQRDEKELHSLAISIDALRDGDLERVADLLAGRYLAVETAALEGSWDTARWLEVSPLTEKGAASTSLLLEARQHQKTVDRAAGRGSYRSSEQNWGYNTSYAGSWGSENYAPQGKGRGQGKGKKGGRGRGGKGKKGQDPWRQEGKGSETDKTAPKDAAK